MIDYQVLFFLHITHQQKILEWTQKSENTVFDATPSLNGTDLQFKAEKKHQKPFTKHQNREKWGKKFSWKIAKVGAGGDAKLNIFFVRLKGISKGAVID